MTESQHENRNEPYYKLKLADYITIVCVLIVLATVGFSLLWLGKNEAFFVPNTAVNTIFNIVTFLGDELGFVILFSFIYFAFDKRFSRRLMWPFMISTHINTTLKVFFKDPRPPSNFDPAFYDPIEGGASGYGLPSGHTQGSVAFYGFSFHQFKGYKGKGKIAIRIITFALLLLVPISRLILGVHDLQDVVFGYLIGYAILMLYFSIEPWVLSLKSKLPLYAKILIGVAFSAGLWIGSIMLFPDIQDKYEFGLTGGVLLAFSIAFPIEDKYVRYDPTKMKTWQRIVYGLIGVVVTVGLYFGLDILFDLIPSVEFAYIFRFMKYFLLALIVTLLVPYIFTLITKKKE